MTALRTAAQQALEFLDAEFGWSPGEAPRIDALRAALAEPVQEPIGFVNAAHLQGLTLGLSGYAEIYVHDSVGRIPLYTSVPPKRTPLTEEEIDALALVNSYLAFARAVERAHGIT